MTPHCPRCGLRMVQRHNRTTCLPFWGCPSYPRCRGTVPVEEADTPGTALTTLQTALRQVTRERDSLRAGYDRLLAEVQTLQAQQRHGGGTTRTVLVRELTHLLTVCHPDRWGGESAVATALTQELLTVRERLKEGRL